ncbi:MAG: hypothetical protein IPM12_16700 [Flavobacteriales bacterium]|nr:hypothetical protein [Flavobacteriales bacterium]
MSRILLASLLSALVLCSRAQQVEVARYDLDQGLPQSMVNHVVQDSLGFIWFGTGDGLARFDGTRMVQFKCDLRDSTTLGNNSIWGLLPMPHGDLLVGTRTGLDRYDARTGRFQRVRTGVEPDGCWWPVHADERGQLLYSPLSMSFLQLNAEVAKAWPTGHAPSYAMHADGSGKVVYHVHPDTLIELDPLGRAGSIAILPHAVNGKVTDLLPMDTHTLILTDEGAWLVGQGECVPVPGEAGDRLREAHGLKHAALAPDGALWVSVDGMGVMVVDDTWRITAFYPLLPADERPLHITTITFDRQGNTWIGTDGKGVFRIAPQRIKFGRCMPGVQQGWSPPSWFTKAFAQWDSMRVLVTFHQGGAALFDERTGRLAPLDVAALIGGPLPDNNIAQMVNDADGHVWMKVGLEILVLDASVPRVLDRMPVAGGATFVTDPGGGLMLVHYPRMDMVSIANGRIQFASRSFSAFQEYIGDGSFMPTRFALDRTGQLWSSFLNEGIRVWGADDERRLGSGWEVTRGVALNLVNMVQKDDRLLMTTDHGLLEINPETRDLLRLRTQKDGLPNDYLYGLLEDDAGQWWISSNNGLTRASGERLRNYTTADGSQSKEFNSKAWFRSRSGRFYFGGVNGFNHFLPGQVLDDPDRPIVRLVRMWTNAGDLDLPHGERNQVLELPYPRNELHLDLAVLEFSASERNAYKWRLRGYHDDWIIAAAATPIQLNNVPGGNFMLEVIGINGDGTESGLEEMLRITVVRPFWTRNWFIAFVITVFIVLIAWFWARAYRRRMQRMLEDAEREMKDLRMRTQLAKDIHDDVGSGLARMAALSRSPKRHTDSDARFEKLSDISGELLENLRDVVWINDPRHGTLDALLRRMREYANDLFEDSGARVTCDFPDPLPARTLGGAFRRNLFLIAKEALHNARKYSGARNIVLRWREDGPSYTFEVIDDGLGIASDVPQGSGHGSVNMRQRAEEMNAAYERIATPGGGTTVRVHGRTLPHD